MTACISAQVNSRDLSLIEQSQDGLVAYRPCFPDEVAWGVLRELKHNRDLFDAGETSRRAIVLSFQEDEARDAIGWFFTLLKLYLRENDTPNPGSLEGIEATWKHEREWMVLFADGSTLEQGWNRVRLELEHEVLPEDYQFDTRSAPARSSIEDQYQTDAEKNQQQGWDLILAELRQGRFTDFIIPGGDYQSISSGGSFDLTTL